MCNCFFLDRRTLNPGAGLILFFPGLLKHPGAFNSVSRFQLTNKISLFYRVHSMSDITAQHGSALQQDSYVSVGGGQHGSATDLPEFRRNTTETRGDLD